MGKTVKCAAAVIALCAAICASAAPRDSLAVAGKKGSIAEAKITADMAAGEITRSQTGHERLEEMDFIFGNVFLSSPDIIRQSENENRPVLYRQQCRCQVLYA